MHSSIANPQVFCIFVISTWVVALASNILGLVFLHDAFVVFQLQRAFAKERVNAVFRVLAVSSLVIILNLSSEVLLMHDMAVTGFLTILICRKARAEKAAAEEKVRKAALEKARIAAEKAKAEKAAAEEKARKAALEKARVAAEKAAAEKKAAEKAAAEKKAAEEKAEANRQHRARFPVGSHVTIATGKYRGDEGIVLRHEQEKTVYKFTWNGEWRDVEVSYDNKYHELHGIVPLL